VFQKVKCSSSARPRTHAAYSSGFILNNTDCYNNMCPRRESTNSAMCVDPDPNPDFNTDTLQVFISIWVKHRYGPSLGAIARAEYGFWKFMLGFKYMLITALDPEHRYQDFETGVALWNELEILLVNLAEVIRSSISKDDENDINSSESDEEKKLRELMPKIVKWCETFQQDSVYWTIVCNEDTDGYKVPSDIS
jgi:hypothetical protein